MRTDGDVWHGGGLGNTRKPDRQKQTKADRASAPSEIPHVSGVNYFFAGSW
jgi:hypothetical protein